MTLHQLRVFITVARLRSYSRAAEELGISQPSVSIQIADLERRLGVELFGQRGRRVFLTDAGRVLERYAQRILELVEETTEKTREAGGVHSIPVEAATDPGFEVIEHTADVGIIAHGETLAEVFASAATGMMSFMILLSEVQSSESRRVVAEADDREALLVAWLNELLLLLNGEGFIPRDFRITELSETRLVAEVSGEPVDPQRHRFHLDVKAATYHMLEIARNDGWHARIIFDV